MNYFATNLSKKRLHMPRHVSTYVIRSFSFFFTFICCFQSMDAYFDDQSWRPCCNDCDCFPFWEKAEYLYWQIESMPEPAPLITTGTNPVLGGDGTIVLLGGRDFKMEPRQGGRFAAGCWFDDCYIYSAEASYMFLGRDSKTQKIKSKGFIGSPLLAFPYINAENSQESIANISLPGVFSGTAILKATNYMQGAELNGMMRLDYCEEIDLEVLAGFRYWNFYEAMSFETNSPFITPPIDVFKTKDKFNAHNSFYGAQLGMTAQYQRNCLLLKVKGKLALGAMCEDIDIHGKLFTNDFNGFGSVQSFPAGYLGMPTNNGPHSCTRFAVIPEINIDLGYQVTCLIKVQIGYTFLYVSNVLRAGNQIDRTINTTQAPAISGIASTAVVGVKRPKPLLKASDLWAQGLNIGLIFEF